MSNLFLKISKNFFYKIKRRLDRLVKFKDNFNNYSLLPAPRSALVNEKILFNREDLKEDFEVKAYYLKYMIGAREKFFEQIRLDDFQNKFGGFIPGYNAEKEKENLEKKYKDL